MGPAGWVITTFRRVGLGATRLSGHAAFAGGSSRAHQEAVALVRRAVELGVNHIDTAASCSSPVVADDDVIATALASRAEHVTNAIKVGLSCDSHGVPLRHRSDCGAGRGSTCVSLAVSIWTWFTRARRIVARSPITSARW